MTIGNGNISVDGAAGKTKITFYDDNGITSKIYSKNYSSNPASDHNVDEAWFLEDDDDFIVADNELSSLVRDVAANSYSTTRSDDTFTFAAGNSSLPALTYSSKK